MVGSALSGGGRWPNRATDDRTRGQTVHRQAVFEGMRHTAAMVSGGAIIMVAVFALFGSAQISIVQEIGIGLAIALILDAVVIRLLVMPAMLLRIGRRVWGRRGVQAATEDSSRELVEAAR